MRDWQKFAWQKGDIQVKTDGSVHLIFTGFCNDSYTNFTGKHVLDSEYVYYDKVDCINTNDFIKTSDDAAQTYINTLEKKLNGTINHETLEIEKQYEFKDGDILVTPSYDSNKCNIFIFSRYDEVGSYNYYIVLLSSGKLQLSSGIPWCSKTDKVRYATEEEKQQLFDALAKEGNAWNSEKKQIVKLKPKVGLKPFDKVLVRDNDTEPWVPAFFEREYKHKFFLLSGFRFNQCIPYEGNESLLGTTKDVEDQI